MDNINFLKLFPGKSFSVLEGCETAAKSLFPISGTGAADPSVSNWLCCCRCYTFHLLEVNATTPAYSDHWVSWGHRSVHE